MAKPLYPNLTFPSGGPHALEVNLSPWPSPSIYVIHSSTLLSFPSFSSSILSSTTPRSILDLFLSNLPHIPRRASKMKVKCTYQDCFKHFNSKDAMIAHKTKDPAHSYCKSCDVDCEDDMHLFIHQLGTLAHSESLCSSRSVRMLMMS